MLYAKLHPNHNVLVDDILFAVSPGTNAGTATRLIGVFAASEEFVVMVFGDVDVVISELGTFVVEGAGIGNHFLESRGVDLVCNWFAINGIAGEVVLYLVGPVSVVVCIEAGRSLNSGFRNGVADAVRVEI